MAFDRRLPLNQPLQLKEPLPDSSRHRERCDRIIINDPMDHTWSEITGHLPDYTTKTGCKSRWATLKQSYEERRPWSTQEESNLARLHNAMNGDWDEIARFRRHRSPKECMYHWLYHMGGRPTSSTYGFDLALPKKIPLGVVPTPQRSARQEMAAIERKPVGTTGKHPAYPDRSHRYSTSEAILAPCGWKRVDAIKSERTTANTHQKWSAKEHQRLCELRKRGTSFAEIADHFYDRTEDACRRYWYRYCEPSRHSRH